METRLQRLRRRRQHQQQWFDHWLGRLTGGLVVSSLLYLLARTPTGRAWLAGAAQLLSR